MTQITGDSRLPSAGIPLSTSSQDQEQTTTQMENTTHNKPPANTPPTPEPTRETLVETLRKCWPSKDYMEADDMKRMIRTMETMLYLPGGPVYQVIDIIEHEIIPSLESICEHLRWIDKGVTGIKFPMYVHLFGEVRVVGVNRASRGIEAQLAWLKSCVGFRDLFLLCTFD